MPRLLIVEDDPIWIRVFQDLFQNSPVTLQSAGTAREGLSLIARDRPDVILLDVNLPDLSGLEAFSRIHDADKRIPIIFITAEGSAETAIEAMQLGAHDYLLKDRLVEPAERMELRKVVERACEISRSAVAPNTPADDAAAEQSADSLIGRCAAMQEVYKAIGRVARQDLTVLIQGESGTGKELVAHALHRYSRRKECPFLAINCAAIPENLLESELFGHEKGAFTGAERKRIGKFEQSSGGTLFLDEIGDMTPLTQAKILRVLQEQRFERLGGQETIQTDVRVVAATHRNLGRMIEEGTFRRDLYYRLSVSTIRLPPLRERLEDLPLLTEHFCTRFNRELGKQVRQVPPETHQILRGYPWPGNVRELQNVVKQALLASTGQILLPEFLPASLRETDAESVPPPTGAEFPDLLRFIQSRLQAASTDLHAEVLAKMESLLLTQALRHTNGSQAQAAKVLGISRNSLRFKIRSLGITIESSIGAGDEQDDPQ